MTFSQTKLHSWIFSKTTKLRCQSKTVSFYAVNFRTTKIGGKKSAQLDFHYAVNIQPIKQNCVILRSQYSKKKVRRYQSKLHNWISINYAVNIQPNKNCTVEYFQKLRCQSKLLSFFYAVCIQTTKLGGEKKKGAINRNCTIRYFRKTKLRSSVYIRHFLKKNHEVSI